MVISLFVHGTHPVTYNRGRCLTPKICHRTSLVIIIHVLVPMCHMKAILACFVYLYKTLSYFVILTFLACRGISVFTNNP